MSIHVDPPRSTPPPLAQALAEAALQRQSLLLGSGREGAAPLQAPHGAPPAGASPQANVQPPLPSIPTLADRVSLSPLAQHSLGSLQGVAGDAARGAQRAIAGQAGADLGAGPPTAPMATGSATRAVAAQSAPALWPVADVPAPLRRVVGALVQQLTAAVLPQQVQQMQPWSPALVRALENSAPGTGGEGPGALQTWLVRQGVVQTPEGPRGVALTLRVPAAWVQAQSPMVAAGAVLGAPLEAVFTGPPQGLPSGVWALVLQGTAAAAPRTSALLTLDVQPQQAAAVYGRDVLQPRSDPWLQMAALQASGQVPREEDKARDGAQALCETPGCPYAGRAVCAQPFCLALRRVAALAPASALGSEAPPGHGAGADAAAAPDRGNP